MRNKTAQNKVINKSSDGFIRIISGQFRGRKLPVKDVQGLRPTTDRIKETVFNWLMQDTRDTNVLDCFAGSGGLGFEALSRFAKSATFIELDLLAATQLEHNITTLKLQNAHVKNINTLSFLEQKNLNEPFDLVFVDPPFRKNLAQISCDFLEKNQWLSSEALIYVEVESDLNSFTKPDNWLLIKEKKAGQVFSRLYQRQSN
ncbi:MULTISPECIES: 16S rRNA (guanine(966)-N(2))-methyltransferase RsmD [Pseudoalteromonas]|uniref:Ribosomal RNA small subunit methyltransferase D n=1 Tax=Pseudoalteromonas fuliginea TaxID=1872678 RepID=A0A063KMD5_9GAMM|nr:MULTISPECIES: 16S rRNA (guanine(966)-N(2))-methyltransferase RsmD [Pseudoalteromonas]ALQ06966.1 16S rRNA (guanine(966)-N(2))-methyltransferase RsmD [Pseudoalteromonas sp. Bsw20308]ATG78783.1 16S rRNA (guanine(966)-N(2))-methyltransferase RsmD [Pseudoalteromonas sp. 1_2015MBL_MicDiv]KAA1150212.1 16S rRNA (guanine(966)-N(2))-methyltransferase RsmD [Pseudoalteromonas fuliginea]KAA1161631.1 16S rRNA (guanine(966)-N(2))-methyltransferase RsmD [Pseudoalteromonas fuliginea]KAA1164950.1 16S rRNA (g